MRVFAASVLLLCLAIFDSKVLPDQSHFIKTAEAQVQRVCLNNRNGRLVSRANCRGARFTPVSAELLQNFATLEPGPQGPQGQQGPQGPKGEDGGYTSILPSGEVMRGAFQLYAVPSALNQTLFTAVSYPNQLDFEPELHFRSSNAAPNEQCPGTRVNPDAAPGHLCVYETQRTALSGAPQIFAHGKNVVPASDPFGFGLMASPSSVGVVAQSRGTWAVRAP